MSEEDIDKRKEEKCHFDKMKNGDEVGLAYFFQKYYKYLVITSFNILGDEDAARDVVQNVFVYFWNKRNQMDIESFKPYLRKMVFNRSIDEIRKKKRKGQILELNEGHHQIESGSGLQNLETQELQDRINDAISRLPSRCRTVFCLSRLENLSHKEISEQLDISVKTIENQITKALKIMREYVYLLDTWLIIFILAKLIIGEYH